MRPAAALRAELHDPIVTLGGGHHRAPFDDVVPVGFLDVHVLPRLAGENRGDCVPVVRSAEHDGMHAFVVQRAAKILDGFRLMPAAVVRFLRAFGKHLLVDVAHVADLDAVGARERAEQSRAATSHAGHTDGDLVVGQVLCRRPSRPRPKR